MTVALDLNDRDWRIIYDALGIAMVNTWSEADGPIPADFENDDYEAVHAKLHLMAKAHGLKLGEETEHD